MNTISLNRYASDNVSAGDRNHQIMQLRWMAIWTSSLVVLACESNRLLEPGDDVVAIGACWYEARSFYETAQRTRIENRNHHRF